MSRHIAPEIVFRMAVTAVLSAGMLTGCTLEQIRTSTANQHLTRGDAAIAGNDLDRALREFEEAVRLNPQLASGYAKIGEVHKERGDYTTAVSYLSEAVRLDPFDFKSTMSLGEVYERLAAHAADRLRQVEAAIRAYLHACDLRPESFDARAHLADCYHQSGNLDAAGEQYAKAAAIDPKNASIQNNLGAVYHAQGKYYEAIRAYKASLEINTSQPIVHVNLGTTYLKQDRLSAAINSFELAIRMDPKLPVAHERLGYCRYRQGDYEAALASYTKAVELDARLADAFGGRGIVEMTLFLKNKDRSEFRNRAVEDWHRSLELEPNQPKLRALLVKYVGEKKPAEPDMLSAGTP